MFYELGKRLFKISKNLVNLARVAIVFFTFFMVAYWIFEIAGAKFIEPFIPFFTSVKDFIHIFYNRTTTIDTVQLDYSFLIFALFLLIITWLLKFVVEFIEDLETRYDSIYRSIKNKAQNLFNLNLEQSNVQLEKKNNHFVVLIQLSAIDLSQDNFYSHKTDNGTNEKQKEVTEEFLTLLSKSLIFQKRVLGDGVLLFFHRVKNVDKILRELAKAVEQVRIQNKDKKWKIDFLSGIETYSSEKEVMNKCKSLMMLIKLNIKNEILCLSTFKHRYSLSENQQFLIEGKGVYNINEEEDVFCVKSMAKQKKIL